MRYELYYQPSIQGRGEFIRLPLEDAGADTSTWPVIPISAVPAS